MNRTIIVADDLTGANDTGLQFAKKGLETKVLIGEPTSLQEILNAEVCVVNSETRSLAANVAYETVYEIANVIKEHEFSICYKKIDSTLRGNVGTEINALMDAIPFDFSIIAPAYPKIGRKTIGGYHIVHNDILEDSEFSRDPKFPISDSHLPTLIKNQTSRKVIHFDINDIRSGLLEKKLNEQLARGEKPFFVFDCAKESDFDEIIAAVAVHNKRVLWVGSAGLMSALSKKIDPSGLKKKAVVQASDEKPFLVVAGSVSAKTREQIEFLKEKSYSVVSLNPILLLEDYFTKKDLSKELDKAEAYLKSNINLVITTENSPVIRKSFEAFCTEKGLMKEDAGDIIAKQLGLLGSQLIQKKLVRGVFLTGGDIAYQTCYQLDLKALKIVGEIEEGIPLCMVDESSLPNVPIITKAGAFGNKFSIYNAISKMATM